MKLWKWLPSVLFVIGVSLSGCHSTQHAIDSSLMSGNQNPAGTAVGVGMSLGWDALEYIYEYYDEEDYEESDVTDDEG